jgi:hypothetical protein
LSPLTTAINQGNVVSGQTSFLQGAAATTDPRNTSNLAQALGSQLTTDLTNMGGAVNLLQQSNGSAGASQTTPDISGSVIPLAQQDNTSSPNNLTLLDRH